jgi:hypothetical protein
MNVQETFDVVVVGAGMCHLSLQTASKQAFEFKFNILQDGMV